jgi:hypothetical protein
VAYVLQHLLGQERAEERSTLGGEALDREQTTLFPTSVG